MVYLLPGIYIGSVYHEILNPAMQSCKMEDRLQHDRTSKRHKDGNLY